MTTPHSGRVGNDRNAGAADHTETQTPQHSPIDAVLDRLDRVRQTAPDRWIASCPTSAHENGDRHPSLAICECDDGTVLLHCYSMQCEAREIMYAAGLEYRDLFVRQVADPRRIRDREREPWNGTNTPRRDRIPHPDLIRLIQFEVLVIMIAVADIVGGEPPDKARRQRLCTAAQRIGAAFEESGVRP